MKIYIMLFSIGLLSGSSLYSMKRKRQSIKNNTASILINLAYPETTTITFDKKEEKKECLEVKQEIDFLSVSTNFCYDIELKIVQNFFLEKKSGKEFTDEERCQTARLSAWYAATALFSSSVIRIAEPIKWWFDSYFVLVFTAFAEDALYKEMRNSIVQITSEKCQNILNELGKKELGKKAIYEGKNIFNSFVCCPFKKGD